MDMNFICENIFFPPFLFHLGAFIGFYNLIGLVREQWLPGVQGGPPHAEAFPLSFCVSHIFFLPKPGSFMLSQP